MKRNTLVILALISMFMFACNKDKNDNENKAVEEEIIPNHELVTTDNMTIIENTDSDMEWDMISRSKIKLQGFELDKALKLLIGDSPARVIIEGEHANPLMEIEYEPIDVWESSKDGNKQVVLDSLQKFYDFEIVTENRKQTVYNIVSIDNELLIPRDDKSLGTSSSLSGKIANYKNYTIEKLAETLEREFDVVFTFELEDKGKYDVELNIVSLEKVLETLKTDYGVIIEKAEQEIEVFVVKF